MDRDGNPLQNLLELAHQDSLTEADADFWKNKVKVDMSKFANFKSELNKSFTVPSPGLKLDSTYANASFLPQNAPREVGSLVPRTPVVGVSDNNKNQNKRTATKPKPQTLKLQPQVK